MAISNIPLNITPVNPQLKDLLDAFGQNLSLNLNCHAIGTIQTFNPADQTATVTINYQKTFFTLDPLTQTYSPTLAAYPPLTSCPVIVLGGANGSLTFPIQTGDECLILFNDRDLSNWFAGSPSSGVATARAHAFPDAMILVGLRSMNHVLSNYDSTRVVLQNGTTQVGLGASLIKIANATYDLNTLLQNLITQIENLVTATAAITVTPGTFVAGATPVTGISGVPANAATITAIATQLSTIATQLGGLLE